MVISPEAVSFIKEYAITEGETIETILTRLFLKNKEGIIMKISKTHFYEKWELEQLIRELEDTPFDSVASEIKDFLSVKMMGNT